MKPRAHCSRALAGAVASLCLAGCATVPNDEIPWQVLNVVDAAQTGSFDSRCMEEKNPLLPKQPTDTEAALAGAVFALGFHYGTEWIRRNEPTWLRTWLIATFVTKAAVVVNNQVLISNGCR